MFLKLYIFIILVNIDKISIMEKIFYKYKSCEDSNFNFVLDSLKNKYFFISRPSQLNDEDEVNIIYNYDVPDSDLIFWLNKHPRIAQKFRFQVFCLKMQGDKRFNNELDYLRYKKNQKDFQEGFNKSNDLEREHFHIFSLTDDNNNLQMWDKYANNYNGICLGFKATNDITCSIPGVTIQNDLFIEVSSDFSYDGILKDDITNRKYYGINPIRYARREKSIIINPFTMLDKKEYDKMKESFLVKNNYVDLKNDRKDWSYERESRLIYVDKHFPREKLIDIKFPYPDSILQEVIFGHNLDSQKKEQILDCLKNNYSNFNTIVFKTF